MRTILIPVDLTGEIEHVLDYAADFCIDVKVDRVILLKSYYVSMYEQILPTPDFVQMAAGYVEDERRAFEAKLKDASIKMQHKCGHGVEIQTAMSSQPLLRAVHEQIADQQPNLVMAGIDNASDNNANTAEQLIAVAKTSTVPMMLIPKGVHYRKIEHAVVPCDFGAISRLNALKGFHTRERWLYPELMVLNVDPRQKYSDDDTSITSNLVDMLQGYRYSVYHSTEKDTVNGILSFARSHDVQMIIALPGKYSFFYNLTHRSITNALATNARRPVLILK